MTTTLEVDGMTCQGCVGNVTTLLEGVIGVESVQVTLSPGRAVVVHGDSVTQSALIDTVEGAGFDAKVISA